MSIKVRYFASLKERVGHSEIELDLAAPLSARNIWRQLNPDLALSENLLAAVNMEYIDLDHPPPAESVAPVRAASAHQPPTGYKVVP